MNDDAPRAKRRLSFRRPFGACIVAATFSLYVGALCVGPLRAEPATFKDCDVCPTMVVVPPGKIAVAAYETLFAEWDACTVEGGCGGLKADDYGWGRGNRPAVGVNWFDAQNYVAWLRRKTGKAYRLPTDAEWETAARGGATTEYSWGDAMEPGRANCRDCGMQGGAQNDASWAGKRTAPAGSYPPNPYGLYDMFGNVLEWVADCAGYAAFPAPGDPPPVPPETCASGAHGQRGGSWRDPATQLGASYRTGDFTGYNGDELGFRVVVER